MKAAKSDAQLRGDLLVQLHLAGDRTPDGWVSVQRLALAVGIADTADRVMRFIDELIVEKLIVDKRPNERGIEERTMAHRLVRLTDKGRDWYHGLLEPIAGVEHWREQ